MKETFAAKTFASWTFRAGAWTGVGTAQEAGTKGRIFHTDASGTAFLAPAPKTLFAGTTEAVTTVGAEQ